MQIGLVEAVPPVVETSDGADLETVQQFKYILTSASPLDQTLQDSKGCHCQWCCSQASCSCYVECDKGLRALQAEGRPAGLVLLLECGPACICSSNCKARTTQQGVTIQLALSWSPDKGWCVKTSEAIPQGRFVCEYAGEYVSGTEAEQRLAEYDKQDRGHALLVVRVQLPSATSSLKCCIDATKTGNVARFINHSCDGGNLEPVVVSMKGNILPRVALFAARDIVAGEELTFSYAVAGRGSVGGSTRRCVCGTAGCSGHLPIA